jgi:WD40 repeat protein
MSPARAVRCPGCKSVFRLKADVPDGKGIKCSECGTKFRVGAPEEAMKTADDGPSLPPVQRGRTTPSRRPSNDQQSSFGAWGVGGVLIGLLLIAGFGIFQFGGFFGSSASKTSTAVTTTAPSPASGPSKPPAEQAGHQTESTPEDPDAETTETETIEAQAEGPETFRFFIADGAQGLQPVSLADGRFTDASAGRGATLKRALKLDGSYFYVDVSDDRLYDVPEDQSESYVVSLEIYDGQPGTLDLQYDAHKVDADLPHDGRWSGTEKIALQGSDTWKQVTFELENVKFANRQQGRADFRLRVEPGAAIAVREIELIPKSEFTPAIASNDKSSAEDSQTRTPANEPLAAVTADDLAPGFRVTWFADTEFDKEIRQEVLQTPIDFFWEKSPGEGIAADGWSARFEGVLPIEKADEYEFHLKSDDGSRLWIDGELIVDNWGLHGPETKSGKTRLAEGLHDLRIDYFDDQYGAHLTLRMTNPTTEKPMNFPPALMRHDARKAQGLKIVKAASGPEKQPAVSSADPAELTGEAAELKLVNKVELKAPQNHGGFRSYAFSPDGKILAGGTGIASVTFGNRKEVFGGEVLLWNPRTGRLTKTLGSHGESVSLVTFSGDGKTLVSVSKDNGLIKVWDVASKKELQSFQLKEGDSSDKPDFDPVLAISPDGKRLAAVPSVPVEEGSSIRTGGKLILWDLDDGQEEWSLENSDLKTLTFSPDGSQLVGQMKHLQESGTDSKGRMRYRQELEVVQIDAQTGTIKTRRPSLQKRTLDAMSFIGETGLLAALSSSGLTLRDLDANETAGRYEWHDDRHFYDAHAFSADGKYLLRGGNEFLELSDLEQGQVIGLLTAEFPDTLWELAISRDLKKVACTFDHNPTVFDVSGAELR